MSFTPTVYTFETEGFSSDDGWFTLDYEEAKEYARKYGLAVIANEYEWVDSELIDDFRLEKTPEPIAGRGFIDLPEDVPWSPGL